MKRTALVVIATLIAAIGVAEPCKTPASGPRSIAVISDLHFGPGMSAEAAAFEDFRWPRALSAFLVRLNEEYGQNIDLVIAGDLFELWQHPTVPCPDARGDRGCSIDDIGKVAEAAVNAHKPELESIGRFASRNGNHVYVIPGNHDASLMLDGVWKTVSDAIGGGDNVTRVTSGRWFSADCRVAVEHGHQIGQDLNRFPDWPRVVVTKDSRDYVFRPWGEAFVADQFNQAEKDYPLVDNVLPLTAGLKLYLDEHSIAHDARDLANFMAFSIFRTSFRQKLNLNVYSESSAATKWDVKEARKLGYHLVASSMPDGDLDRDKLLASSDSQWKEARQIFDERLADATATSDDEMSTFCDLAAEYAHQRELDKTAAGERVQCSQALLIAAAAASIPERYVLASHVSEIQKTQRKIRYFIYGHTHQYVTPFPVRLTSGVTAVVLNDGAFQRLTSLQTLSEVNARKRKNDLGEKSSLLKSRLEDLPPCYSFAVVSYEKGIPAPDVKIWSFGENYRTGTIYRPEALGNICEPR